MRRSLAVCIVLLVPFGFLLADSSAFTTQADTLHDQGKFAEAKNFLLDAAKSAASGKEKAELFWRAARETLEIGDLAEKAKQPTADILKIFVEGEGYADKAIEADPQNDLGIYWKSSNIGRWGQVKGILDSLFKAGPMRDLLFKVLALNPDRSDAYYVLGQLYRELPGWPLSFGNIDQAVSLGRKAVDLRTEQFQAGAEKDLVFNFYTELAKTLYKRNWSAASRAGEQKNKASRYAAAKTPFEKASAYEAAVTLKDLSDRDEAKDLAQWTISQLEKLPSLTAGQSKDLQKAKDALKGW